MSPLIRIKVKPHNAAGAGVDTDSHGLVVRVKALPEKGKANLEVRRVLADFFKVAIKEIEIKSGFNSRNKTIRIPEGIDIDRYLGGKHG